MLQALFDFYYSLFSDLTMTDSGGTFLDMTFHIGGYELTMVDYLPLICSLISLIVIVVLCCLFVYKIIKLIGGLIR